MKLLTKDEAAEQLEIMNIWLIPIKNQDQPG
jgi:hypothetical protein